MTKRIVTILLSCLTFAIAWADPGTGFPPCLPLPDPEVTRGIGTLIEALRQRIIPPRGTDQADVERVFGEPVQEKEDAQSGLITCIYQLLPPKPRQEFRAYLYVRFWKGMVHVAGMHHVCQLKGVPLYGSDSKVQREKRRVDWENRLVLVDLIQIYGKFLPQISSAVWHRRQPELPGTAADAKFGTSVDELVGGLIAALEKRIVPPVDTQRDAVKAIFGAGEVVGPPQEVGRDDEGLIYPHQAYELLPGDPELGGGVVLWVQFKNETVARAGLRNYCVNLHRPVYVGGPEFDDARQQQREEIARERRLVLADLLKIECQYRPAFGAEQGTRNSDKSTGSVSDSPGAAAGK